MNFFKVRRGSVFFEHSKKSEANCFTCFMAATPLLNPNPNPNLNPNPTPKHYTNPNSTLF